MIKMHHKLSNFAGAKGFGNVESIRLNVMDVRKGK